MGKGKRENKPIRRVRSLGELKSASGRDVSQQVGSLGIKIRCVESEILVEWKYDLIS
jgi:hypothetical protein